MKNTQPKFVVEEVYDAYPVGDLKTYFLARVRDENSGEISHTIVSDRGFTEGRSGSTFQTRIFYVPVEAGSPLIPDNCLGFKEKDDILKDWKELISREGRFLR